MSGNLQVARKTTKVVEALQHPTNISKVRSFLGLCNKYRRVVSNFARLSEHLNKKLKKIKPFCFELDTVDREVVDTLKEQLIKLPLLALPRRDGSTPRRPMHVTPKSVVFCYKSKKTRF